MAHGSWLMAHGSWFMVHGSWLMDHDSWLNTFAVTTIIIVDLALLPWVTTIIIVDTSKFESGGQKMHAGGSIGTRRLHDGKKIPSATL